MFIILTLITYTSVRAFRVCTCCIWIVIMVFKIRDVQYKSKGNLKFWDQLALETPIKLLNFTLFAIKFTAFRYFLAFWLNSWYVLTTRRTSGQSATGQWTAWTCRTLWRRAGWAGREASQTAWACAQSWRCARQWASGPARRRCTTSTADLPATAIFARLR